MLGLIENGIAITGFLLIFIAVMAGNSGDPR